MKKSEGIENITKALVAVQAAVESPKRSKTADTGAYKYKYADLDAVIESVRSLMVENGLAFTQEAISPEQGSGCGVTTLLLHTSGEWIESGPLFLPAGNTPQNYGSALTYARRYGLLAALGIATEEDDDGAAAKPKKAASKPTAAPAPKADPEADRLRGVINEALTAGLVTPQEAQEAADKHGVGTSETLAAASSAVLSSLLDTLGITDGERVPA